MHILDVLKERGFIAQTTFEDELYKQLDRTRPPSTSASIRPRTRLHIGHYIPIMAMAHMQRAGHRPIALMGGGTGNDRRPVRQDRHAQDDDPSRRSTTTSSASRSR